MNSAGSRFVGSALLVSALLFPLTPSLAASAASDNSGSRLTAGKPAQVKTLRAAKRKAVSRPAPPEGILLKDLTTGEILFQENAEQPMAPASLTKIMSAIVILEEGNLDDQVTVSRQAAAAHRTKLYLKPGQVLPLRGLLEAMLIRSANDACLAAVEHVAGTEAAFVEKMNAKALTIGLTHTHFQNACGFDMPEHYSTAAELAVMTEYAMGHETFAAIVRSPSAVIRTNDQRRTYVARTTNRLLGTMDGVIGVKTGYTRGAGRCLITVVSREDRDILLVLLNARHRWGRAQDLIAYGFRSPADASVVSER